MGVSNEDWEDLIQARIGADGSSRVEIAAYQMEDPYTFGRFLGDVVRHGALAYATTWSVDESEALERICEGLSDKLRLQDTPIKCVQPGSLDS
jgi:hypothetical protein